ncbi:6-phosphogluconolactonase, partial [Bifidobacterium animalis]
NMPQVGINDPDVLVTGVTNSPKMPPLRLSLTVPMIVRTDYVWVCGSREGKAEAMGLTFHAQNNPALPASYADAVQQVLWITDEAAGRDC